MTVQTGIRGSVVGLLLAAGYSRRFGADKRLCVLSNGLTMLQTSVSILVGCCDLVTVALRGSDRSDVEGLLGEYVTQPHVTPFFATRSPEGMGSTLAEALATMELKHTDHLFIALADMPFVQLKTLRSLLDCRREGAMVIPTYRGAWGHPVLFSGCWCPELARLSGDRGALSLLKSNPLAQIRVEVDDPMIIADIDEPRDMT